MVSKKRQEKPGLAGYTLEDAKDLPLDLDPHLQELLIAYKHDGKIDEAASVGQSSDGRPCVDVIAKLKDPLIRVPGLDVSRTMGSIVTGSITIDKVEQVRKHDNVVSLKRATTVDADLKFSIPDIKAVPSDIRGSLPANFPAVDGTGVIVGIVDFGCDFQHDNFRKADGKSRLLFLWDQNGGRTAKSPAGFDYGREYNSAQIDTALASPAPYQSLGYEPKARAHGTHVMDTAAGNGRGTGHPGVAPAADLIFVELAAADFTDDESFGNSRRLLEAVDYIFDKAKQLGRPAVVNLSLGTHGGPHDGSTLAEQGMDNLLTEPGRAIVISAGNSHERSAHVRGKVGPGQTQSITWQLVTDDPTANECEIWYEGTDMLEYTLVSPSGVRFGPVAPGSPRVIRRTDGSIAGRLLHRLNDPNNRAHQIDILLERDLSDGDWQIELKGLGTNDVEYHGWIERDDFGQSAFASPDPMFTLGSISCGKNTIAVASYDARDPEKLISSFSASGPTRDGRNKPELSAPGHGVIAARSLSRTGTTQMSGTSMAAPHVTGVVALMMQAVGQPVAVADLRDDLLATVRASSSASWDRRFGHGRVQAAAAVAAHVGVPALANAQDAFVNRDVLEAKVMNGNGAGSHSEPGRLTDLLNSMVMLSSTGQTRVKLQIEVEPVRHDDGIPF